MSKDLLKDGWRIITTREKLERHSVLNYKTGCLEWTGSLSRGYGNLNIKDVDGKWRVRGAHRVAYQEYVGEIPKGLCVCHKCDNPKCINTDHLFLGIHKDNADDRERKGRNNSPCGERQGLSKLTEAQVLRIRELIKLGLSQTEIAIRFGVRQAAIGRIVHRKTWRHVN